VAATGREAGLANLKPFPPGNVAAVTHGARSERRVSAVATTQKRRWLRQNRLRLSDLEGVGIALLDNWARAQAKVELLDHHFAEHGFLDGEGKPHAASAFYFTALNSAARTLRQLSEHLRTPRQRDALADYLESNYGSSGDA
jgi:hypothetical protein